MDVRLSVRVGLGVRFEFDPVGMPSRISFSSPNEGPRSRLGRGRLESGPAIPCRTSKLERFWMRGVKDDGGGGPSSKSDGVMGGESRMPGGRGRGPRRMELRRVLSCAC